MFGTFWDMPVQLHAFWDAVEKKCTWEQHEEFASILDRAVVEIRRDAEKPRRDCNGEIKWKRSVPIVQRALTDGIEASARVFFTSVYSHCEAERPRLSKHERTFWGRHRRLCCAVARAKRDREDVYRVMLCLRSRLPNEVCCTVASMLL